MNNYAINGLKSLSLWILWKLRVGDTWKDVVSVLMPNINFNDYHNFDSHQESIEGGKVYNSQKEKGLFNGILWQHPA